MPYAMPQELTSEIFISATLSAPFKKEGEWGEKVTFRTIGDKVQCSWIKNKQAFHKNYPKKDILEALKAHFQAFKELHVYTTTADYRLLKNEAGTLSCKKTPPSKLPTEESHNRVKSHPLPEGKKDPFLIELGLMTATGKIVASQAHKFRQINRFIELIMQDLPKEKPLQIVDLGCGKAYLSFALYHYLTHVKGWKVHMTGIDLKEEVMENSRALAKQLQYNALTFITGDIATYTPTTPVDIVISLHACDTATDKALAKAIEWKTPLIYAVPCCQQELFKQIQSKPLKAFLKHGILKERLAALVTDACRASLLESVGYETNLIEFISLDDSPKNLMIRAKSAPTNQERAKQEYLELKAALSVTPCLETLLQA